MLMDLYLLHLWVGLAKDYKSIILWVLRLLSLEIYWVSIVGLLYINLPINQKGGKLLIFNPRRMGLWLLAFKLRQMA